MIDSDFTQDKEIGIIREFLMIKESQSNIKMNFQQDYF